MSIRKVIEMAVSLWAVFHFVLIVKTTVEKDWLMLGITIPFVIINIWCIVRIHNYYKANPNANKD